MSVMNFFQYLRNILRDVLQLLLRPSAEAAVPCSRGRPRLASEEIVKWLKTAVAP
jgi:hypothetical protein